MFVAIMASAGCGASVDANPEDPLDAPITADAPPPPIDAPIAPDTRICAGGDASMSAADGSCIVLFNQPLAFADARTACTAFGSQLAIIDSAERDLTARALAGGLDVFIGLTDQAQENLFKWVDGSPMVFSNFAAGEPNDANGAFPEDCIIVNGPRDGLWDDRPCAPDPTTTAPGVYPYLCLF
jgi:hypothetical protein